MITVKINNADNHHNVQTQRGSILQLNTKLRFLCLSVALTSRETSGEVNISHYKDLNTVSECHTH